jgi:hypothetical protein
MTHTWIATMLMRLATSVAGGSPDLEACQALAQNLPAIEASAADLDTASQLRLAALRPFIQAGVEPASDADSAVVMKTWGRQFHQDSADSDSAVVMKTWGRQFHQDSADGGAPEPGEDSGKS